VTLKFPTICGGGTRPRTGPFSSRNGDPGDPLVAVQRSFPFRVRKAGVTRVTPPHSLVPSSRSVLVDIVFLSIPQPFGIRTLRVFGDCDKCHQAPKVGPVQRCNTDVT
jgi:hypothetical protein